MQVTGLLLATGAVWGVLWLLIKTAEHLVGPGFAQFFESRNITLSLANVRWFTVRLNPLFSYVGNKYRRALDIWFGAGVVFGVLALVSSVIFLAYNLTRSLLRPSEVQALTPIIPGVNLPSQQLLPYFLTLAVSGIFHELGHAFAAVVEKKVVHGFGLFLFVLYPGAFVQLPDDLHVGLSPYRQLKIFCAGVWHNFVLALIGLLLLFSLPALLSLAYRQPNGVLVGSVPETSPLHGHLFAGDIIVAIDDTPVHSRADWLRTLTALHTAVSEPSSNSSDAARSSPPRVAARGYCVFESWVGEGHDNNNHADNSSPPCCDFSAAERGPLQCFRWHPDGLGDDAAREVCLSARKVMSDSLEGCQSNAACAPEGGSVCLYPVTDPGHLIVKLTIGPGQSSAPQSPGARDGLVLFDGTPASLYHSIIASDYEPRLRFLSPFLPEDLDEALRYLVSISMALALLNIAPVYYLDGQHALSAILQLVDLAPSTRTVLTTYLLGGTSLLLAANIAVSLVSLL
jgi:S2P endopeptidase